MACEKCKDIGESFPEKPFFLHGKPCNETLHACKCGTKWWQYNTVYHFWRKIPEETFLALQKDRYTVVDINSGKVVGRGFGFN